jgi:CheY-like chemotaxis protein
LARKILLADDSVTAQNMGRKILADAGYEVTTVNNGSAALKKIGEQRPDLIVLDVYMPGYSGLEVCQRLKETQDTARIPILLTVGKLEPFKPEEAKRMRADGFIVKPFEASELLSALSKLEDKIVPRPEASKPGRFARANAALDEGRYDKTMAVEEDSGWKNRIGFPKKKKKSEPEPEFVDDPAIYNPINKDLHMVVERRPPSQPAAPKAGDSRLDLSALVPEGLPKDVTAEEIAALAAAAAQVKGKFEESNSAEPEAQGVAAQIPEVKPAEARAEEQIQPSSLVKSQAKSETSQERQPAAESPQSIAASALPEAASDQQKPDETIAASADLAGEVRKEATGDAPDATEAIAAPAGASQEIGAPANAGSGNGSWVHTTGQPADEPATMAAAAGAESHTSASRWTAVDVALAPEEVSLSLESEMQKAHAAFAAAEAAQTRSLAATHEPQPAAIEAAVSSQVSSPVNMATEPSDSVPPTSAEASQPMSMTAGAEPVSPAVREFEKVAGSESRSPFEEQQPTPAAPEPAPVESADAVAQPALDAPPSVEAKAEEAKREDLSAVETSVPKPEAANLVEAREDRPETRSEEPKSELPKTEEPKIDESKSQQPENYEPIGEPTGGSPIAPVSMASDETPAASVEKTDAATSAFPNEVSASQPPADQDLPDAAAQASEYHAAGGIQDMAKKESEIAATTAAAWASWRRIRESGETKPHSSDKQTSEEGSVPQDKAAMAAAAGAEKAPGEAPSVPEESEEIASIVDSVLADLRPKIVEEISKKMGKKK